MPRTLLLLTPAILVAAITPRGVLAKEEYTVTVTYAVRPAKPLPDGLRAVAVIDAGVETRGAEQQDREAKWSKIAADMIEAMLQGANQRFDTGLAVAKRQFTKQVLDEQDLRLAGLVEGDAAERAGKLLDVQGLVTSQIIIDIDVSKTAKSTIDWTGFLGGAIEQFTDRRDDRRDEGRAHPRSAERRDRPRRVDRAPADPTRRRVYVDPRASRRSGYYAQPAAPYPPPEAEPAAPLPTREVEEVSRHVTVQCSFSLIDAVTGEAILQHSPPPFQKKDKTSPDFFFGNMVQDVDLDPVDHFVGELVEQAVREFVGMIVPVEIDAAYELVGRGKHGEAGIRSLRADDYAQALDHLQTAYRDDPEECETVFAMGVVSELMGRPEQALDAYRRAAAMEDVDDDELAVYVAAKQRLTAHLDRIIRPGQPPDPRSGRPPGRPDASGQPPPATQPAATHPPASSPASGG